MTGSSGSLPSPASNPPDELIDKLKGYIRTRGLHFLNDPNITSVGVGYKQTEGQPTDEIALQFTVAKKVSGLEQLESLGSEEIPKTIDIDGFTIPTDVVERVFEAGFRPVVQKEALDPRKIRCDPIQPGLSVSHENGTAGTIGAIVYDMHTGDPYVLSNWHVLHGSTGHIGDDVVQPGNHDDNRKHLNRLGTLARSHLGAAGDCAIASIDDRTFATDIYRLDVSVNAIGEVDLGNRVVKSGRTTRVTYGRVTRVHIMVRIDYGDDVGERVIGGFEIGIDTERPPEHGEISMKGDSGSAWMFFDGENPTNMMAGLHFAGEASADVYEHALACYPTSFFPKLEIRPTVPTRPSDDRLGEGCGSGTLRGYNPNFLDVPVPPPSLTDCGMRDAHLHNGQPVKPYTHFTVSLNTRRRLAAWVAWNIDGGAIRRVDRRGMRFRLDPDIPSECQVDNELYRHNPLDRGHIARRADLCWGPTPEAQAANRDSFYFTNVAPQLDTFNQSGRDGIWGRLEDAVFEDATVDDLRVSVIAGPVFRDDDRPYRGVRIPREFYKVIAYVDGTLKIRSFLLTQQLNRLEALDLSAFQVYQVTLDEIEQRTECRFADELKQAESFAEVLASRPEMEFERTPLTALDQIQW